MPPITGQFVSSDGGRLGFRAFAGFLPAQGSEPPAINRTLLDVDRWELVREPVTDETTHTGSYAARAIDLLGLAWRLAAEVSWDLYKPPNFLAQFGQLSAPVGGYNVGCQVWAYVGSSGLYYFSPSARIGVCTTVNDAAGREVVRARIDLLGNAPVFAFGTGALTEQAYYDAYIRHCATRGYVW